MDGSGVKKGKLGSADLRRKPRVDLDTRGARPRGSKLLYHTRCPVLAAGLFISYPKERVISYHAGHDHAPFTVKVNEA